MYKINVFYTNKPLEILKRIIYKIILNFLPLNYTYQFVFILRKI